MNLNGSVSVGSFGPTPSWLREKSHKVIELALASDTSSAADVEDSSLAALSPPQASGSCGTNDASSTANVQCDHATAVPHKRALLTSADELANDEFVSPSLMGARIIRTHTGVHNFASATAVRIVWMSRSMNVFAGT